MFFYLRLPLVTCICFEFWLAHYTVFFSLWLARAIILHWLWFYNTLLKTTIWENQFIYHVHSSSSGLNLFWITSLTFILLYFNQYCIGQVMVNITNLLQRKINQKNLNHNIICIVNPDERSENNPCSDFSKHRQKVFVSAFQSNTPKDALKLDGLILINK